MRNPIVLQPGPPIPMPSLPNIEPFDHDLFSQSLLHPNNQETIGALTKAWNHVFVDRMLGKDAADETDAQGDVGACVGVCSTNESDEEREQRGKDAKRMSPSEVEKAAKANGYRDAHGLKNEYNLDRKTDLFVDKFGELYEGNTKGTGVPKPLGIYKDGR